ncbi:MAG: tetratricopeptide repeat-containing glycosyltransferase [Christensenellales bacterium]|jgi:glycosyltransferase involved in cell wall biosynthesis
MGKYKICAYAICKNEEKFVDRWFDSVKEADLVIVGDTGSTDNTVAKLREKGATVHELNVNPFRFDTSRNMLLDLIPEDVDICVSSDMDEVISKGWRKALEDAWTNDTTRASCKYVWSHNPDGSPGVVHLYQRIHARHGYKWYYPTHEIVAFTGKGCEKSVFIDGMVYNHYPDTAKSRSFNLHLLELAVKEFPDSERNMHYLGREYLMARQWDNCIYTLLKYLDMPSAKWKEERAASMRFISRAYIGKNDYQSAKSWLMRAIAEKPDIRDAYIEMALLMHSMQDWLSVYYFTEYALRIKDRPIGYASEAFSYDDTPYDLMAISSYRLGMKKSAIKYSNMALRVNPSSERLINNHKIYLSGEYPENIFV